MPQRPPSSEAARHGPPGTDALSPETLAGIEWVFGYGSLMWNPGFAHIDRRPARLDGYHRAFCIYSHHYRGTPDHPGLVLGLDAGGMCKGVAFRFDTADRDGVIAYLNERELIGYAYRPAVVDLTLEDGRSTAAYTFVTDPTHPQYAGDLSPERSAALIMSAAGRGGLNRDYLMNTLNQLELHGFHEQSLHDLLVRVRHLTGLLDQGGGI